MFTLTSLISPARSRRSSRESGATAWQGPHHSAQKSTQDGAFRLEHFVLEGRFGHHFCHFQGSFPQSVSTISTNARTGCARSRPTVESKHLMAQTFQSLPAVPDHAALEREILAWWDDAGRLQTGSASRIRGGPSAGASSTGRITANNPMGVHHAWGRTLKDVFQRYKALRGYDQRYQNGFDCQGLWVEVEVEKALGLNSKREIEEYGLAEFAARCRERVAELRRGDHRSSRAARPVDGLGQRLLHLLATRTSSTSGGSSRTCTSRGWLYKGHRSTQWCPRCGTSLSQHEQAGEENYGARAPVALRPLPAARPRRRVARRLDDDAVDAARERRRGGQARTPSTGSPTTASGVAADAVPATYDAASSRGEELVGLEYDGPVRRPARAARRRAPRDPVGRGRARRGHRASSTSRPGAGAEDFELGRVHDLPVLAPIDEAGRFSPGYGLLEGLVDGRGRRTDRRRSAARARAARRGRARSPTATRSAGAARRRSSSASSTTGSSRVDEIRAAAARRERDGRVDAAAVQEAHGRLAAQHGRLEHLAQALLRPAAAVLPVRVRTR